MEFVEAPQEVTEDGHDDVAVGPPFHASLLQLAVIAKAVADHGAALNHAPDFAAVDKYARSDQERCAIQIFQQAKAWQEFSLEQRAAILARASAYMYGLCGVPAKNAAMRFKALARDPTLFVEPPVENATCKTWAQLTRVEQHAAAHSLRLKLPYPLLSECAAVGRAIWPVVCPAGDSDGAAWERHVERMYDDSDDHDWSDTCELAKWSESFTADFRQRHAMVVKTVVAAAHQQRLQREDWKHFWFCMSHHFDVAQYYVEQAKPVAKAKPKAAKKLPPAQPPSKPRVEMPPGVIELNAWSARRKQLKMKPL